MAARLGKATAVVMALAGLLWNWWLILVAVLVYVSARTEIRNKGRNVAGSKGQVRDAMLTRFSTVSADATVNDVFDQLRDGCSWALPVVDHGRFLGIVDRDRFLEAIAASDWQHRAGSSCNRSIRSSGKPIPWKNPGAACRGTSSTWSLSCGPTSLWALSQRAA